MKSLFKIKNKQFIVYKSLLLAISAIFVLSLKGCYDNSDQIVNESLPSKYFKVDELIKKEFNTNKTNFIEHVILVEGIVKDINYLNNRYTIILRGKANVNTLVICDMQENQKELLKRQELGKTIRVKGILKGSLKDIILLNCIIIN
ncbi:OB-fold putative lipoprotein [Flaviramulus sp. BrNp1-15]|uniref:OB-fold putative lipoprotein n=1 Tax=Flaviramulus sp. BrNp1-15 TaxID=2916754 RepID=UPI001EE78A2B|nr:OB-fold putative lipoprotein [Flaviramulus sp. BrNp1-15]ULC59877.1 OB-fold putative lipoprotein [Flaviramulus sp. BrNp1-15]